MPVCCAGFYPAVILPLMIVLTITSVETVSGEGRGEVGGVRLKGALSMTMFQAAKLSQLAEGC